MDTTHGPEVAIDLAGARITIPSATIADLWLERARLKPAAPGSLPRIGEIVNGRRFAGIMAGRDGAPDYRLYCLGFAEEATTWEGAQEFASSKGGFRPTREEGRVLWANLDFGAKESFWFWLDPQYAGVEDYAWYQYFDGGGQDNDHKSSRCRARAVSREPIQ
jgi:hypothetical protein